MSLGNIISRQPLFDFETWFIKMTSERFFLSHVICVLSYVNHALYKEICNGYDILVICLISIQVFLIFNIKLIPIA